MYGNDEKGEAISLTPGFSPVTASIKIKETV